MTINEFLSALETVERIVFSLPNGGIIAPHFHITEVGQLDRFYIDCGGTVRKESSANMQLYVANDTDHRLAPAKLHRIIASAQQQLGLGDLPVQMERQGATIEKYGLAFDRGIFYLTAMQTDCLAKESCGIPTQENDGLYATHNTHAVAVGEGVPEKKPSCVPGSGCC